MRGFHDDSTPVRALARWGAIAWLALLLTACGGGGGGGTTTASTNGTPAAPGTTTTSGGPAAGAPVSAPATPQAANAVTLVVDQGTDGSAINTPFVTVTVCEPNTATCQTIDHVMVDTGSYGLRVAASAITSLALPAVLAPNSAPLAECANFVSGFAWGAVRSADVRIGGETALNVPIQVVKDPGPAYTFVPASCSNTGPEMGVGTGAKGILGVGFLKQDCGSACTQSTAPAIYFSCPSSGCTSTTVPLASQVTDPVTLFATDNNGVAITLPEVPLGGSSQVTGSLVFGIGTESNNQLGSGQQVYVATNSGNFTTVYKGRTLSAFVDSGSNGIFFHDSSIPTCSGGFYCPPSPLSLTATFSGTNGTSRSVPFTVESVAALPAGTAAAHLGGDLGLTANFDWGLPFFFSRTVLQAFQGASTPYGTGPYLAF